MSQFINGLTKTKKNLHLLYVDFFYSIQCLYFCIAGGAFNPRKGTRPPFLPPSSILICWMVAFYNITFIQEVNRLKVELQHVGSYESACRSS